MKQLTFLAVMSALLLSSCSQDEVMSPLDNSVDTAVNKKITYTVTADNSSRAASAYSNGTDVNEIHVWAWAVRPTKDEEGNLTYALPGYGSPNTDNASFIEHDVLKRSGGTSGTFSYGTNARFWPTANQSLDFWAIVDAPSEMECFTWYGGSDREHPCLPKKAKQLGKSQMKDMLYAYTPNQTLDKNGHQAQQNVTFSLNHAFAKVRISAQVRNTNLRVVISDIQIHGIGTDSYFNYPYKSGSGGETIENDATWTKPLDYMVLTDLIDADEIVVDGSSIYEQGADTIQSREEVAGFSIYDENNKMTLNNDILVIPAEYSGRNSSKLQTYIQLEVCAYNIARKEFDEDTDMLVCGTRDNNGNPRPAIINVPIEFDWVMGTINTYNIIFDCGTGGTSTENPKDPSMVRIGYEVEVNPWQNGENLDKEYNFETGKTE